MHGHTVKINILYYWWNLALNLEGADPFVSMFRLQFNLDAYSTNSSNKWIEPSSNSDKIKSSELNFLIGRILQSQDAKITITR
jgi:hypothetical protein